MPMITNPIKFSVEASKLIEEKKQTIGFDHTNWSDDDLLPVRREIREHYRNTQRLQCAYCLNPISSVSASGAHIEHIIPKSKYLIFLFEPKNLCTICPDCNEIKRNQETSNQIQNPLKPNSIVRYPKSSNSFKIVHPHIDQYEEHILKANRIYIDRTPKGHWTIGACKLNRFAHRFGASDELINDIETIEMEEEFHNRD